MAAKRSLKSQILYWLTAYALLLAIAIFLHGYIVNERAEELVWESLLKAELQHHLERAAADPDYEWNDTETLRFYEPGRGTPAPAALLTLPPGVHDELVLGGREYVVLVEENDDGRYIMSLDITELEEKERTLSLFILSYAALLVLAIGVLSAFGLRRVLRPLWRMADDIEKLTPDRCGQRIVVDENASAELEVIAGAINDYLVRHEQFVERERVFIDSASHELRTPIAVITGATELALAQPDLTSLSREQISRAHRTARDVEQLISLLLVLAKEPGQLSKHNDRVPLDDLVAGIVNDHLHLAANKDLRVVCDPLPQIDIIAPFSIVQVAIGNLLRNAIENSDHGEVRVDLTDDATVVIKDSGHGMTPEEISRIHARLARDGERRGSGIGLDLLRRICEHLGWRLDIESAPGKGTRSTLRFPAPALKTELRWKT